MKCQKKLNTCFLIIITVFIWHCSKQPENKISQNTQNTISDFPKLSGPYLGQIPPGKEPKLFAPGFISDGMNNRDSAFTPDGKEYYYTVFFKVGEQYMFTIMVTKSLNGVWTKPEVALFSGLYTDVEPCISHDGMTFIFCSNRPLTGNEPLPSDVNLWMMKRSGSGWSEPQSLGPLINTPVMEAFPSLTTDGTLYFTRNSEDFSQSQIYRSRLVNGQYTEPEKLPEIINSQEIPLHFNSFIARDESYLIISSYRKEGNFGKSDYYISFRDKDDRWSIPINLGEIINSPEQEISPYVTLDGKYFFFSSNKVSGNHYFQETNGFFARPKAFINKRFKYEDLEKFYHLPQNGDQDIYWMDASFIEELRLKSQFPEDGTRD